MSCIKCIIKRKLNLELSLFPKQVERENPEQGFGLDKYEIRCGALGSGAPRRRPIPRSDYFL